MSDSHHHKSRFGDNHAGGPMRRGRRGGGVGGGRRGEPFGGGAGGGRPGGHHGESRDENKPCRSLFVRNIQFEATEDDLRKVFEPYGEIKEVYSRIQDRGIVFIHYYDLRAAERAKEDGGNISIGGRDPDIHYSFPKDDIRSVKCDETKNQGTLLLSLNGTEESLVDDELYEQFRQFGDIKVIRTPNFKTYSENTARWQRLLEYYDSRAAVNAAKATHGKEYKDGVWDVNFFWDQGLKGNGGRDGSPARRSDRFKRHEPYQHHRHDNDQRQVRFSPPATRSQPPYGSAHSINTMVPPQPQSQMPPGEPTLDNAQKAQRLLSLLSQLQTANTSTPAQTPPPVPSSMAYPPQSSVPPPPQNNEGIQQLLGLLTQVALNSAQQPPALPLQQQQQQQQQQQVYTQFPSYHYPPRQPPPAYSVQNQYAYSSLQQQQLQQPQLQQQPSQQQPSQRQEPQGQPYLTYPPQHTTENDIPAQSSSYPPHIPYSP